MKENSALERLKNGIITENPTFVLTLGMCPTLAVTTSAVNGLGMGLTTMAVLALSNMFISMLRKVIWIEKEHGSRIVTVVATANGMEIMMMLSIGAKTDMK